MPFPDGMADSVKTWAIGTLNQQRNLLSRAVTLCIFHIVYCMIHSGIFSSCSC